MSLLYPLFLAGVLAVAAPIILHMIRRHTRKRITYSSLLFLRTTVPRFTNKSKIENIFLLILRCLILILLAIAFSRPFLKSGTTAQNNDNLGRRIVLLIDNSASMNRSDLWQQAIEQAREVVDDIEPADRLCVMCFNKTAETLVGFESWSQMDPGLRSSTVKQELSDMKPGWESTDLGNALISAAEVMEDDEINIQKPSSGRQIILISDLQQGSSLEALYSYEWPDGLELNVKTVTSAQNTNAAMQYLLTGNNLLSDESDETISVRIINSENAIQENFRLSWQGQEASDFMSEPVDVYVPAGQSVVTELPVGAGSVTTGKLVLTGDRNDFDNTLYLAPNLQQQIKVLYISNESASDTSAMLYYLQLALQPTSLIKPEVTVISPDSAVSRADMESAQLIIVTDTVRTDTVEQLRSRLASGQAILLAMKSADIASTIGALTGITNINAEPGDVDDYAMLANIDFTHPLLSVFSESRFRDFSKIHFWNYQKFSLDSVPQARVLAAFDNDDPALFEIPVEAGTLLVLTSGWQPSDSQLALSSKFVPLLYSLLEYNNAVDTEQSQYYVGDPIRVSQIISEDITDVIITSPDGTQNRLEPGQQFFTQTEVPGIYNIRSNDTNRLFAINLPLQESRTAPLSLDELEQYGVRFENFVSEASIQRALKKEQYSSLVDMENAQKLWRRVFAGIFFVLLMETLLAGWLTRPAKTVQEQSND